MIEAATGPTQVSDPATGIPLVRLATQPKQGRDDENDDRAAAGTRPRIALADGASTSARAEVWAEILVCAYVVDGVDIFDPEVLEELRTEWQRRVHDENLPWYALAKLQHGGAATFVGIEFAHSRYRAVAVGDACLLQFRGGQLITAGPLDDPTQFGRTPPLISTLAGDRSHMPAIWRHEAELMSGDHLVLASDALAKHLLTRHSLGKTIDPATIPDDEEFHEWVAEARRTGMDNDDTTICVMVQP
ncbi:hypothetical protein [Nocardia sp. NBC_00511]|uniref:hypothetical protein n=1 Tax=Nocardia sp. NBC_00511 TaxID=2903591 RepID=UPI0030E16D7B